MTERQPKRAVYCLRITSVRPGDDIKQLRSLLKWMLRVRGWRCVAAEQERAATDPIKSQPS
jgi:hypothetical protein